MLTFGFKSSAKVLESAPEFGPGLLRRPAQEDVRHVRLFVVQAIGVGDPTGYAAAAEIPIGVRARVANQISACGGGSP